MIKFTTLLLVTLAFLSLPSWLMAADGKMFTGCGPDKAQAKLNLGQNIFSDVKSASSSKVAVKTRSWLDFFIGEQVGREEETSNQINSSVFLCDVNVEKRNGEFCAEVSQAALEKCANNKLNTQLTYTEANLSKFGATKLGKAKKWLSDIDSSKGLYTVVQNALDEAKTNKLIDIEAFLLSVLDNQNVRFEIEGNNLKIKIDDSQFIKPNRDVSMKVGTHSYVISSNGFCPIKGNFKLTSKQKVVIKHDLSKASFPQVTFTSNQGNRAQLTVDGKSYPMGKTVTFNRCEGKIAYAYKFENDIEEDTFTLRPGLKTKISENFTSAADRNARKQIANQYRQGSLWQIDYMHMSLTSNADSVDSFNGVRFSRSKLDNALRHGTRISYAQDDKESYAVALSYHIQLQLLKLGKKQSPLGLGSMPIVPHAGIEFGLGYHNLDGKDTFENPSSSDYEKFYKSFVVLRPTVGLGIPINGDFGFDISYSRSLFMNKANIFTIGINLRR